MEFLSILHESTLVIIYRVYILVIIYCVHTLVIIYCVYILVIIYCVNSKVDEFFKPNSTETFKDQKQQERRIFLLEQVMNSLLYAIDVTPASCVDSQSVIFTVNSHVY